MRREEHTATKLARESCKTLDIGIDGYEECLRAGPNLCRYALPFGYGFLCHHPRLDDVRAADRRAASAAQPELKAAFHG